MSDMKHWEAAGYSEITGVETTPEAVIVEFANGDRVEIEPAKLGADKKTEFELNKEGELLAINPDGERAIDWTVVRSSTDQRFATELRERDADESRRIGRRLRALRENRDISQKAAAETAGMKQPQLARIEKGESDLRVSTMRTLLRSLGASFSDIAGPDAPEVSVKQLSKVARKAGAPTELLERIADAVGPAGLTSALARAFSWRPEELLAGSAQCPALAVPVAFKTKSQAEENTSPMLHLARTLSEISAEVVPIEQAELPATAEEIRGEILATNKVVTLKSLTDWAWDRGVIVLPMSGPGFSAAAWYVGSTPVIVLKAKPDLIAFWTFTLAHEIAHLILRHVSEGGIVDVDVPGTRSASDEEEEAANEFALDLVVPGSDAIFAEIQERSGQALGEQKQNFKWRAKEAAEKAGLSPALVALTAAHALPDVAEPGDRWGSATNLAKEEGEGRPLLQQSYAERIDISHCPELDAALIRAVVLE